MVPGRVVAQQRGHYVLMTDYGELTARLAHAAAVGGHPAVGDWVAVATDGVSKTLNHRQIVEVYRSLLRFRA